MRFVRSLGCGFVVLLALWPLASLKLHAVELGPIAQPLLSAAARQRLTALATRYVAEGSGSGSASDGASWRTVGCSRQWLASAPLLIIAPAFKR